MQRGPPLNRKHVALLLLLTFAAVLVHGYHPAAEDGELYLSAIKKDLRPELYPFNSQFFMSHARMTLFDELITASVRVTHLPFDYAILLWHLGCVFALLAGCWQVGRICFRDERAAWGGAMLVAALLTTPVAGTALYIMDQYLSPRDFSTAGIVLVLALALRGRRWMATIGILLVTLIHPLMAGFGAALLTFLNMEMRRSTRSSAAGPGATTAVMALALPFSLPLSEVYRQLLRTNDSYFLVIRWHWYEWLGIVIPLAALGWTARYAKRRNLPEMKALSRASILFGLVFFAAALVLCIPALAGLTLLQPMRCLHLIFIVLFILLGGVLAQAVLRAHLWRWALLFVPLCLVMFFVQRQLFPASQHLELPGRAPTNAWIQAFDWSRQHTPGDAIFALNRNYMNLPGEDEHGFRALAERSTVATIHDNGGVSMFPGMADDWYRQVQALHGWNNFQAADFCRLREQYGVTWLVLERRSVPGLTCPYENAVVQVCQID